VVLGSDLRGRIALAALAATFLLGAGLADGAHAQATSNATAAGDLQKIEHAAAELGRAKRSASGTVARLSGRSNGVLGACTSGGPGWKKIRHVKHAPQRALYTAAARRLLADMKLLIDQQQSRIVAYESAFERFVTALRNAHVSQPLLAEAVAAQGRRLASYKQIRAVEANCNVFNKLVSKVREFPTRTAAQVVRVDYRSTPIARRIERHISNQLRAIDRRVGIAWGDVATLDRAADLMVSLGGNPGYALGFQYALSLR
jgi:hypothetical protein